MSIDFATLCFRHDGRIDRRSFWMGLASLILTGLFAAMVPVVGPLLPLLCLWPAFCLLAQRLHDIGRSSRPAVWIIVPAALMSALTAAAGFAQQVSGLPPALLPVVAMIGLAAGLALLATLAVVIWAGLKPGQRGWNDWGYSPRSPIAVGRAA